MATLPPETILPPAASREAETEALLGALAALQGEAARLALLARLAAEPDESATRFAPLIAAARPGQRQLLAQAIADCRAMLAAGLAALETLLARGQDPCAPALALWRELHAARAAMLALLGAPAPAAAAATAQA